MVVKIIPKSNNTIKMNSPFDIKAKIANGKLNLVTEKTKVPIGNVYANWKSASSKPGQDVLLNTGKLDI